MDWTCIITILLSVSSFTYKPCQDCNGVDRVMILLEEEPVSGVPVATASVTLEITISAVNDPPQVFVGRNGYSLVPTVANKTIVVRKRILNIHFWFYKLKRRNEN